MKNKLSKNSIFLIILILLAIVVILHKKIHMSTPPDYFSVKDTANITSISLHDQTDTIEILKINNAWYVNGKWQVNKRMLDDFLNIIMKIEIKSPLSDKTALKSLEEVKEKGVYVKINRHKQIIKSYIFYENYENGINSFLYDLSKEKLFLVKLPGNYIKLALFFTTNQQQWRSNTLLHLKPFEIESVSLLYPQRENSLKIMKDSISGYSLLNYKNQRLYSITRNIERYLTYFQNITYEKTYEKNEISHLDTTNQIVTLNIKQINGNHYSFNFYRLPLTHKTSQNKFDLNYLLVKNNTQKKYYKVKYLEIDLLLKNIQYFK